jgi:hypothetical protein
MAKGYQGLLRYRHERATYTDPISKRLGDCFHDGHTVLPVVHQWHEHIRSLLRTCDRITPGVLKLVTDYMFQVPDYRLDARQLWGRVKQLIDSSPVGTSTYGTLLTGGGSMNIGPSAGSRTPHDSPHRQWHPDLSRTLPQTPAKQDNLYSGYSVPNINGRLPMVSQTHVAEPDTLSMYAGEAHGGLNYVSSGTHKNHMSGQYNRPMSQPEASIERPDAQHFISDNQPPGQILKSLFDNDHSREVWTSNIPFRDRGSAPDKRHSQLPNHRSASASRNYAIRPGPSGNLDKDDLYDASGDENEYRQSHQRGPSDASLPSSAHQHQPGWSSPHEGQPDRPNLNSSPTSIPSSPPPIQQSPPIPSSSTVPTQATTAATQPPVPGKEKVSGRSKRQAAANELPNLPLITAQEWRRVKKENAKLRNIFKKREEPYLPGKFLLGRVGKRDHVCILEELHSLNFDCAN